MSRFVFAFLLVLVAACGGEPTPQTQQTPPPAESSDRSALAPGWSQLEPPPFARARAASVWMGEELFFWGGDTDFGGTTHGDGAVYDARSAEWRRIPSGPLTPRASAAAVWTGREVLVWGGGESDGAAFDPAANAWRQLPEAPLSSRETVAAVWTGKEMIVWGGTSRHTAAVDGAAYDPAADTWRTLPPAPFALNQAAAVWTGHEMIVYGALLDGNNWSETKHAGGIAYDPDKDTWRVLAPFSLSPQASSAVWTGEEMLAWDYELHAGAYDPVSDTWREMPDLPLGFSECYPHGAAVARFVLAYHCGSAALFDLETEAWSIVPGRLEIHGRPISAGPVVLFAGAAHEGHGNALWAYKPAAEGASGFVARTERRGQRTLMPLTFPDGTSVVLSYPEWLRLGELGVQPDVSYFYLDDAAARFPLTFVHGAATAGPSQVALPAGSWTILAQLRAPGEKEVVERSLRTRETPDGFPTVEALPPLALSHDFGEGGGMQLALGDLSPEPDTVSSLDPLIELAPGNCRLPQEPDDTEIKYGHGAMCLSDLYVGVYGDRPFIEAVLAGLRLESG